MRRSIGPLLSLVFCFPPLVAQGLPVGNVDNVYSSGLVVGWAVDPTNSTTSTMPIRVDLYAVDPSSTEYFLGWVTTSIRLAGLTQYPNNVAGFNFTLSPRHLFAANTRIKGVAYNVSMGNPTELFSRAPVPFTLDAMGVIDGITADGVVFGWALTPVTATPLPVPDIEFYIDEGDHMKRLGVIKPSIPRPDVVIATGYQGNHGFDFRVPTRFLYEGPHNIYVFAVDRTHSASFRLFNSGWGLPSYARPQGTFVGIDAAGVATGTAWDPKAPGSPVTVEFNGDAPAGIGTLIGSATTTVPGNGFSFTMPASWMNGAHHRIHASVVDTAAPTLRAEIGSSPQNVGTQNFEILMRPNLGSRDFKDMFDTNIVPNPAELLALLDGFGFYQGHFLVHGTDGHGYWNNFNHPNLRFPIILQGLGAFSLFSARNVTLDLETPIIKDFDCTGALLQTGMGAATIAAMNYATVGSVSFDEPLGAYVYSCPQPHPPVDPLPAAANYVRGHINYLRTINPTGKVGDIEPWHDFTVDQLNRWVDLLHSGGTTLDRLILDVGRNYAKEKYRFRWRDQLIEDLQRLSYHCRTRVPPVKFGVIFMGETDASDTVNYQELTGPNVDALLLPRNTAFHNDAMDWAGVVRDAIGTPDMIMVQSFIWTFISNGPTSQYAFVPDNLRAPGLQPHQDFSMTTLLHRVVGEVTAANAEYVSQVVPAQVLRGTQFSATVTFRVKGPVPWSSRRKFRLGSQGPGDNLTWGTGRVSLPTTQVYGNGSLVTFSMLLTSPTTPGNYNFEWRMVQESVKWFGQGSPSTIIQVQ